MEYNYYLLFISFFVIGSVIVIDPNVAEYLTLVFKMAMLNIERFWWMIKFHPRNPIQKYLIARRSWNIAKKMMEEIESKQKELPQE